MFKFSSRGPWLSGWLRGCLLALTFFGCGWLHAASAALVVTNLNDNLAANGCTAANVGDGCSLREAITDANNNGGSLDNITFTTGLTGIIQLQGALPITSDINLNGLGANVITLRRSTGTSSVITVDAASTSTISGLTMTNGNPAGDGGGILNAGNLTLQNCAISGNVAANGGGISNTGTLNMTGCTLSGNTATTSGGGLYNLGGIVNVSNCTFSGNTATTSGGGIYNYSDNGTALTVNSSTITLNTAPAGQGSGVASYGASGVVSTFGSTIIAGNTDSDVDLVGSNTDSFVSTGYNVIGSGATGAFNQTGDQTGVTGTQLKLGPLADNGGTTLTHLPQSGSPALDKGNATGSDQRGQARPSDFNTIRNAGNGADVGAVEVQAPADQQSGPAYTVNTTADHDDGSCSAGDCTLREAIDASNAVGGTHPITFDSTVFGSARQTITLSGGALFGGSNFTLSGPSVGVTVDGNHASNIFSINSGTVSLINLTITNGQASSGGGVLVSGGGNLTLTNCTISGNSATGDGGGLYNNGGAITVTNCTISGNSAAGNGGGLMSFLGSGTLQSCTITLNTAPAGQGSGLGIPGFPGNGSFTVGNTIIAGNTNSDVDVVIINAVNPLISSGYNLIGGGTGTSNFNQTGDRTGVTSAQLKLGPLANNGGPTPTHQPLAGSLAIDGGNAAGNAASADQRGLPRPYDFPNVPNAANGSDVGAVEAQVPTLNLNPALSGGNNSVTFTEKGSPVPLAAGAATLSAPNGPTLNGATVTLASTPNGSAEALSATTAGTAITAAYDATTRTLTLSGGDTPAHYLQVLKSVSYNNTSADPTGATRTATFTVSDSNTSSNPVTTTITVVPVNDAPTFTSAGNVTVAEDSGVYSQLWATNLSPVEAGQTLTITVANNNNSLFLLQPSLNPNGVLTFTPASNANGQAIVTVTVKDSGGTANGGVDTKTVTFIVTVTAVNDAPVAASQSVTTTEDTPLAITLLATDVEGSPLSFSIVSAPAHGTLLLNGANVTYTPAANYNGTDSFTFKANDGALDSNTATINITVAPVNDAPVAQDDAYSLAGGSPFTVAAPGVLGNDTDADGNSLQAVVVTQPAHGTLTLNAAGSFTYTPAIGFNGGDSFTYKANDGALDSNVATVALTVSGNATSTASLKLSSSTVKEGTLVTGTLTLSHPATSNVTVTLSSSNKTVATVPASVTVAAGQTSATFTVTTLKNALATGPQLVTISASAGAYGTASANLTVTDNEIPTLTLTVVPNAINENSGPAAALATLTRNTPTTKALSVTLINTNLKALKVPTTVVIPAGASAVTFLVATLDNRITNLAQTAQLTARAIGYRDGIAKLTIADNGKVSQDLKLTLAGGTTYIEQVGGQTVVGTISLSGLPLTKDLTITLISSDPKRASLPVSVLLKAGQTKVSFSLRILDNTVADGSHQVWLTARALGFGTSAVPITVLDNDGPALSLSLPQTSVAENAGSLTATVTRLHVPLTASLTVSLSSSDKTRITVPLTVTIPAGKAAITFKVSILNNNVVDGNHVITLTASKSGFLAGTSKLTVVDDDKPVAAATRSAVGLSTATASAANGVQLRFTGALDTDSAQDATHYTVTVNGVAVEVQSLSYAAATHTVTLTLADGAVQVGDNVVVSWQDVQDGQGHLLSGSTGALIAR